MDQPANRQIRINHTYTLLAKSIVYCKVGVVFGLLCEILYYSLHTILSRFVFGFSFSAG